MRPTQYHFFPLALPFLLALLVLALVVVGLIEVGLLRYAYEKMGIDRRYVFTVLLLSLLGSYINIPIAELPPEQIVSHRVVGFFGMQYVVPVVREWPATVIALNVGGAVVPIVVSFYLLAKNRLWVRGAIAVAVVATVVHLMARPVPGIGIAVPVFIPPIVAAATGLVLAFRRSAPALAYVAGSLGTLVGADLANLWRIQGLGAPIASIGGAGTFDGIFLTGILAVLLA